MPHRAASTLATLGVLAALVLAALAGLRRIQQARRRAGRRIPASASGKPEAELAIAAAGIDLDRLDQALRVLSARLADTQDTDGPQLPDVRGAWITGEALTLFLADDAGDAPPPFLAGDGGWLLPHDIDLPGDEFGQLAPFPTLVTVAQDRDDEHCLLLDLEPLGILGITGDEITAEQLGYYIVAELASNVWSDDVRITLAGFDERAEDFIALNPDRVSAVDSVDVGLAQLAQHLTDGRALLDRFSMASAVGGRVAGAVADVWTPRIVVFADPEPRHLAELVRLDELFEGGPRIGVAAVVISTEVALEGLRNVVVVDADETLRVEFIGGGPFRASQLPYPLVPQVAAALARARADHDEPMPAADETEAWAAGTDITGALLADATPDSDDQDADADADADAAGDDGGEEVPFDDRIDEQPAPAPARPRLVAVDPATPRGTTAAADPVAPANGARPSREHLDPELDADVAAWVAGDATRPRIAILGPVEITAPGKYPARRAPFWAEIIVYLAALGQRGTTSDALQETIWNTIINPVTYRSAISTTRDWLGPRPDGTKWLPDMGADLVYRIEAGYLFDWMLFRRLRARGEARGAGGRGDLRQALEFVRGAPLEHAEDRVSRNAQARRPYHWLTHDRPLSRYDIAAAVVDTAHQYATLCLDLPDPDLDAARWAVEKAWLASPQRCDVQPWLDAIRIAKIAGREAEVDALLRQVLDTWQVEYFEDLDFFPDLMRLVPRLRNAS